MDLNSEEIVDLITKENLKSNDVKIDLINKKIYITAINENIDFLTNYMSEQGFEYVGETVKLQYDHNCCECKEPFDYTKPPSDPVKCFVLTSSSSSESFQDDNCSPLVTLQKYAFQEAGGCYIGNVSLDLDTNCGCDTAGNCAWRTELEPVWYEVTDTISLNKYWKLVGGFSQLKVENNNYVFRELQEETFYPPLLIPLVSYTEVQLTECPCILENRKNSKFLKVNVLINYHEDFDNFTNNQWNYENNSETYTFLKLENATNYCYSNKSNLIDPTGVYAENDELINEWIFELSNEPNVFVTHINEVC